MKDELIAILKNECGFTEKESINLLESVKATSEEQLKKDVERFLKYINDITSKDSVIRMIALGFTDVEYNSENDDIDDFSIALRDKERMKNQAGSKMEQTTTLSQSDLVDCPSTPEDIADTNELESLRSMREEIQRLVSMVKRDLFRERIDFDNTKEVVLHGLMIEIDKVVNPNY